MKSYKFLILNVLLAPSVSFSQGFFESPVSGSTESGVGTIRGWHCNVKRVEAKIDNVLVASAPSGGTRTGTESYCGTQETGYSLLINYNAYSVGPHNLKVYGDGVLIGDVNFNTVKSGGEEYLKNVSKQTTVNDFPKAGQTAVLTWSEAKQNFVVTSASTGPSAPSGISIYYGTLTLNYKFTGSSTTFTDSAYFSAANLNSNGTAVMNYVTGNSNRVMSCGITANVSAYPYLCMILDNTYKTLELFRMNMSSNGVVTDGFYEYCSSTTSTESCVSDLVSTPDGIVTGSVYKSYEFQTNSEKVIDPFATFNLKNELKSIEKVDAKNLKLDSINEFNLIFQQLQNVK